MPEPEVCLLAANVAKRIGPPLLASRTEVHGTLGHDAGAVRGGVGVHRQDGRVRDADAAGTGAQVVVDRLAETLTGGDRDRHGPGQRAAAIGGIQVGNVDLAGVAGGVIQREPLFEASARAPFGKVPCLKTPAPVACSAAVCRWV